MNQTGALQAAALKHKDRNMLLPEAQAVFRGDVQVVAAVEPHVHVLNAEDDNPWIPIQGKADVLRLRNTCAHGRATDPCAAGFRRDASDIY